MPPLTLPSVPASVSRAVELAESAARRCGLSEEDVIRVGLAVAEAVANAVEHGCEGDPNCDVTFAMTESDAHLSVRVSDGGRGVSSDAIRDAALPTNPLETEGRGLYLIRELTDEVRVEEGAVHLVFTPREGA